MLLCYALLVCCVSIDVMEEKKFNHFVSWSVFNPRDYFVFFEKSTLIMRFGFVAFFIRWVF